MLITFSPVEDQTMVAGSKIDTLYHVAIKPGLYGKAVHVQVLINFILLHYLIVFMIENK